MSSSRGKGLPSMRMVRLCAGGEPLRAQPDVQGRAEAESRFHAVLPDVMGLLQRETSHVSQAHLCLRSRRGVLEDLREELVLRQVAIAAEGPRLDGRGTTRCPIRAGSRQPASRLDSAVVSPTSSPTRPPRVTETGTSSHSLTTPPEAVTTDALHNEPSVTPEPPSYCR